MNVPKLTNTQLEYYKKSYIDLKHMDMNQLISHWETIGYHEKRLYEKSYFDKKFPHFDYMVYKKHDCTIKFSNKYEIYGWVYIKHKTSYYKWLISNGYINATHDYGYRKNMVDTQTIDFGTFVEKNNIKYIYVSQALKHFEKRICEKFGLQLAGGGHHIKCDSSVVVFGLYDLEDFEFVTGLCVGHGTKYLMWGGTDSNANFAFRHKIMSRIKYYLDIQHLVISNAIRDSIGKFGIYGQSILLNLVDEKIFNVKIKECYRNKISDGKKYIFIYNGFTKGNEYIYGKKIYEQIVRELTDYHYIYSNELNVPYEKMPEIYSKCFIGLRLTAHDGSANTVQEMVSMGIPVVHNGEQGGISWKTVDDVKQTIQMYSNWAL